MARVWQLANPADIRVFHFDGEAVVFNPAGWQTHILNDSGAVVLDALRARPRSPHELVALLSNTAGAGDHSTLADAVDGLLAELFSDGLIEPVDA